MLKLDLKIKKNYKFSDPKNISKNPKKNPKKANLKQSKLLKSTTK